MKTDHITQQHKTLLHILTSVSSKKKIGQKAASESASTLKVLPFISLRSMMTLLTAFKGISVYMHFQSI
jgi:hypothetical protein